MDDADRASELETMERDSVIQQRRLNRLIGRSRIACIDCNDEIPEPRRRALPGVTRCAPCQTEEETRLLHETLRR